MNDMVISWLQNAMSTEIKNNIIYIDTTFDLWMELEQRFAQNNGPCIYDLKQAIHYLSQDSDLVSAYFSKLKGLLDEL